ncbi:MAG: hypothetical protein HQL37_03180, partial [Alphaproteobacteria bacterium]|nr:hypothetical protein [Alphaproteobacteria bacterium]
ALLISLFLLLFYLKRRPLSLFFTAIIGSFVWQSTSQYGAILLISMYMVLQQDDIEPKAPSVGSVRLIKSGWVVVLILSVVACVVLWLFLPSSTIRQGEVASLGNRLARFVSHTPTLIACIIAILTMIGSSRLVGSVFSSWRSVRPHLLILAVASLLIPALIVRTISNPNVPNVSNFLLVLRAVILPPYLEGKFLLAPLTLTVFWGPAILLMVFYWRDVCVELRRLGPGAVAIVGITLLLGLATEPRFILGGYPFLVLALVLVLERLKPSRPFLYAFFALSILYAEFWLKLNIPPWKEWPLFDGGQEFPKQMMLMHLGMFMSMTSYFIHLPVVIISGWWLMRVRPKIS